MRIIRDIICLICKVCSLGRYTQIILEGWEVENSDNRNQEENLKIRCERGVLGIRSLLALTLSLLFSKMAILTVLPNVFLLGTWLQLYGEKREVFSK